MLINKQSKHCINFCFIKVFVEMFSLEKKVVLCNITLIPPKPIEADVIIVFIFKAMLVEDKEAIPPVISIVPHKKELTTS